MVQQEEVNGVSSANTANLEFATPEKQQARAFLRERFLRVVTGIVGKQAEFYLHENTRVSGEFRGCNVESSEIFVRNLETPIGKIPEAILRGSDIIHLSIDIDIDQ
ncbi:gem-associated protein 7-like [Odontomachus brunneus]|uniref:gem-associated protein 7-like n=1 Tax=Odontomachus brunneus TaxID=486640 RepID=UPI0013F1BA83|nr:gem-associated protein 7-like [Odontomachus brunneus]XP_032662694.1 gem-associated protein 7-like [Odontomachus brunneus]XP_032662695.1 gem-associated protein 7-like [Odontomachus brunneus]